MVLVSERWEEVPEAGRAAKGSGAHGGRTDWRHNETNG